MALALALMLGLLAAEAQAAAPIPHLGILLTGSSASPTPFPEVDAFMKRLGELGWVEGQNLAVDRRWAETPDRFSGLAADLVRLNVNSILALGSDATRAARTATSSTPIIMVASTDPRQVGGTSFAHPSGNLTGFTVGLRKMRGDGTYDELWQEYFAEVEANLVKPFSRHILLPDLNHKARREEDCPLLWYRKGEEVGAHERQPRTEGPGAC